MTRARLTVSLPDWCWKGALSRRFPETTVRTRATGGGGGAAWIELVTLAGPDVGACAAALESLDGVADAAVVERNGDEATVEVRSDAAPILRAGAESGVPIETPFDVVSGEATVDVTSTHEGLSALGEALESLDCRYEVAFVRSDLQPTELLTSTQRDLLFAAVEGGYYETPRRCTLTELAERVGIAKSTCSETLQRVEETVVGYFLREACGTAVVDGGVNSDDTATAERAPESRAVVGERSSD